MVSTLGIAVYIFQSYLQTPSARLLQAALIGSGAVILAIVFYILTYRIQGSDKRTLPVPVRSSFYVFVVVLLFAGILLILNRPNILPWTISKEASVVYGWIFLGASVYFLYALFKNTWDYAAGPLVGFLAYDAVLIAPFIRQFSEVRQNQLLSLVVYSLVVVYSALLAIYYLVIYAKTRFW